MKLKNKGIKKQGNVITEKLKEAEKLETQRGIETENGNNVKKRTNEQT